jgi:hypothetical protein
MNDDQLEIASQEISDKRARILGQVMCGPCEQSLAILYATSVGQMWRMVSRNHKFFADGPTVILVDCPRHGRGLLPADQITAALAGSSPRPFRLYVDWSSGSLP